MSILIQNIKQVSTEVKISLPTWQDIEKAIIDVLRAGIFYNIEKNKGFMDYYKKLYNELHQSEDPDVYIIDKARHILPNKEIYNIKINSYKNSYYKGKPKIAKAMIKYHELIHKIAKEYYINDEERKDELQTWLNS